MDYEAEIAELESQVKAASESQRLATHALYAARDRLIAAKKAQLRATAESIGIIFGRSVVRRGDRRGPYEAVIVGIERSKWSSEPVLVTKRITKLGVPGKKLDPLAFKSQLEIVRTLEEPVE
jgi:hypothetical protein